jgi:hypothetical protein
MRSLRILLMKIPRTDEDLERLRRSVVMLAPGHPSGLDREAAMTLLGELQRLKQRNVRAVALTTELLELLDEAPLRPKTSYQD